MKTIDVGRDFAARLTTRNEAIIFCEKYLKELEDLSNWQSNEPFIVLDFVNVKRISPSFASEAFGGFLSIALPERILKKIVFKNLTNVQRSIIDIELHLDLDENIDLSDLPEFDDEFWENAQVIEKGELFKKLKRSDR